MILMVQNVATYERPMSNTNKIGRYERKYIRMIFMF